MKKIRLTESELVRLIKKLVNEQLSDEIFVQKTTTSISNEDRYTDFLIACQIAKKVEDFWKYPSKSTDEEQSHEEFFSAFQNTFDDDDEGAALAYKNKLNSYRDDLSKRLNLGKKSKYYIKIDEWFNKIIDEMDDYFQNADNCVLELISPNGKEVRTFRVDPEID